MDLAEAWRTLPLGAADRHAEALTLAATRALRAGRPAEAFEFVDRRCRIDAPPRAVDLAIRALAARLCGRPGEAERDLARAEGADPLDPTVAMTRLGLGADPDTVRQLGTVLATGGPVAPNLLGSFLKRLAEIDAVPGFVGLDILDDRLSGFAAWPAGRRAVLELAGPDGGLDLDLAPNPALGFVPPGMAAAYLDAPVPGALDRHRLRDAAGTLLVEGRIWPRRSRAPGPASGRCAPQAVPARAPLTVVVPVYRDLKATRACFEALLGEVERYGDARIVAVDDASPEPAIATLLDALAADRRIALLRNAGNLGFAGAVQRGLANERGRDVLLLNADAVLPPGALERLAAAVYGAPDIGTATPFSNNGEYTSLPRPAEANEAPGPEAALRIDAAAAKLDGGVVDMPTGTGFCLFVRHDCLHAVGGMPAVYGRGYFEDMEFCLLARRAGYRSVCATAVYVVHRGGASFGLEKRALAVRNLAILRRRFPGIAAECAAFAQGDPLRAARNALIAEAGLLPAATGDRDFTSTPPEGVPERPPSLGVLSPTPSPGADAFIRRLAAKLRAQAPAARIVVLGATGDDLALMGRGNVFVTGALAPGEAASVARHYGVLAFASNGDPAPDCGLPFLDPAGAASPNARHSDPPDHDPAHAIVAQFARRIAAAPPG